MAFRFLKSILGVRSLRMALNSFMEYDTQMWDRAYPVQLVQSLCTVTSSQYPHPFNGMQVATPIFYEKFPHADISLSSRNFAYVRTPHLS
eukprot:1161128-Pelagomonas_calceolata.AAC.7